MDVVQAVYCNADLNRLRAYMNIADVPAPELKVTGGVWHNDIY